MTTRLVDERRRNLRPPTCSMSHRFPGDSPVSGVTYTIRSPVLPAIFAQSIRNGGAWSGNALTKRPRTANGSSALVAALMPSAIDRLRAAYLVETLGENGLSEGHVLAALEDVPLARRDVLDAIERAGEIGAIELRDGLLRPP